MEPTYQAPLEMSVKSTLMNICEEQDEKHKNNIKF
jgi:hypothetical protein